MGILLKNSSLDFWREVHEGRWKLEISYDSSSSVREKVHGDKFWLG